MLHHYCRYKARGRPRKRWTNEITEAVKDTIYVAHTKACSRELLSTLMLFGKQEKRNEDSIIYLVDGSSITAKGCPIIALCKSSKVFVIVLFKPYQAKCLS
jgi:hypothetical protein